MAAISGRRSFTIGTNCRRRRHAIEGQSRLRLCTRPGSRRPTSIATRPPRELPTRCARSTPMASMNRVTERANQAASYGARSGLDEEPNPGRSIACTVCRGVRAETVSKKLVLLLPRPWIRITVSIPSPAVSVEILALPARTSWMRSRGGRPCGRWKKPSKATARSRLPLAQSRRERKASRPESRPSRSSSQVSASVPMTTSGSRSGETVTRQRLSSSSTAQLTPRSSSSIR